MWRLYVDCGMSESESTDLLQVIETELFLFIDYFTVLYGKDFIFLQKTKRLH